MLYKNPITFDIESHKNIFNLIFKHKKISAANLARLTGMQKSSLLYITRALEDRKLIRIHTKAFKTKQRGRPSTLYEVNPELFSILGVEIVPGFIKIVLTSLQGQIICRSVSPYNFTNSRELSEIIKEQLKQWKIEEDDLLGIGVAIPGMVTMDSGSIISSVSLDINSLPIQAELQEFFKTSVLVVNDAKAGASGTYLLSKLKEVNWENILFYTVSLNFNGIGLGIIFDGKQYNGTNGQAGEINKPIPALDELCQEVGITTSDFFDRENDEITPQIDEIYNKLKVVIGQLIVDTSQLLNPDYFEIGGDVAIYKNFFENYLIPEIKRIQDENYSSIYEAPTFNPSSYGEYSNTLGAAASVLQCVLT